jgi:hypothetical protein
MLLTSYRADLCKPVHQPRGLPLLAPRQGVCVLEYCPGDDLRNIGRVAQNKIYWVEAVVAVDSKIVSATELLPEIDVF